MNLVNKNNINPILCTHRKFQMGIFCIHLRNVYFFNVSTLKYKILFNVRKIQFTQSELARSKHYRSKEKLLGTW